MRGELPRPVGMETKPATVDDVKAVLDQELHPHHRDDPTVLKFINAYLMTRDLKQSASEAGIDKRAAGVLRARRDIWNAIKKITDMTVLKYGLDPNEIVERVKDIAYLDPADFFHEDGRVKTNIHEIPASARRAIKSIKHKTLYGPDINGVKEEQGYMTEFTFWEKTKSLELLGREESLFKETIVQRHDIGDNMKETLLESRDRAAERMERMRAEKERRDVGTGSKALPEGGDNSQGHWRDNNRRDTVDVVAKPTQATNEIGFPRPAEPVEHKEGEE